MKFKRGDNVKILSGQYIGMRGTVVEIMDGAVYSILVSVVGFSPVWFTPKQIENIAALEKPKQIEHPDLTELRQACAEYVDAVSEVDPGSDDDVDLSEAEGAIAESALNAFYGEGVWDFINERVT